MIKGREIKGAKVFLGRKKEEIGRVNDLVINQEQGLIVGLVISSNGIWQKLYYVALEQVKTMDKNGIYISNKNNLKNYKKKLHPCLGASLVGGKILSAEGKEQGTISDLIIENNNIKGMEISAGIIQDMNAGRSFIAWSNLNNTKMQGQQADNNDEQQFYLS